MPTLKIRWIAWLTSVCVVIYGSAIASEQLTHGITEPVIFPRFDPHAALCKPPNGLAPTLAYIQENDREFLAGVDHGLALAARDRGLQYRRLLVDSDIKAAIDALKQLRRDKVGAIIATSSDPNAIAPYLEGAIGDGQFVGTIVPPPATLLLNAPQYLTGKVLTDAAIEYITTTLSGRANVVLLTQDSMQYLAPRFDAMRDGLSQLPGVNIIADIAPPIVSKDGGYRTMNTVLTANPGTQIDVVLGADSVVLGALQALRETGRADPKQFLGGIDGEPEAVAEVERANGPYKVSIALSSAVFGYAMGSFGADWLAGKSVPQAMDTLPIVLTAKNLKQYRDDEMHPDEVFENPARRESYLRAYGNICYATRDRYVNFPWSSERRE